MAFILSSTFHPTKVNDPAPRFSHCAAAVGGKCYLWGGFVQDFVEIGRKKLVSTVEIFDPYLETWQKYPTTGDPPPGLYDAACTSLLDSLYWFGGYDGSFFYNSLHRLDPTTLKWTELQPENKAEGPMRKKWCGMVSFSQDQLATFGGYGRPKSPIQSGATFIRIPFGSGMGWSNELHVFDITRSKWSSPPTTGSRPSPSYFFSFTAIDNHQAVFFGGNQPQHQGYKDYRVNDCFLMDFESMHWTKLENTEGAPWPVGRDSHAACCLNFGEEDPQLLVTGGYNGKTLSDGWILDVKSRKWRELTLHEATQTRLRHTTTAISLEPGRTRVIMFGGCPTWLWGKPEYEQQKLAITAVLEFALENQLHYEAYQHALKEGVKISLKYVKFLFYDPPRTGKTSTRRRLVGEIQNLAKEPVQASTGTSKHYDVIVMLPDKISTSTTVITKSKWSAVKVLFGKEKNIHETDLDDELRLLYRFIYEVAPPIVERSPVPDPFIEEKTQNEATKAPSSAGQMKMKTDVQSPIRIKPPKPVEISCNADNLNPDVSVLHKVSSDRGPGHGLDAKGMEEIEMAFEAFDKVLQTPRQEELKVLLDRTILVSMVDTGGQPAFLEMLPALTISPALYLIFFRLNQELKKRYKVQYVSEAHEEIHLGESSYTVEEVIFQALSSIAFFSCAVPNQVNMPNLSHAAMLIGTHKDELGNDPETVATEIKAKDDALQKSLTDILKSDKNVLRRASVDHLVFAIDNMTGDKAELENIHKRLQNIIEQEFDDFPIPASWLMFSIFLRKMGKRTMSLLQCYEIGNRLRVENTDEALWFLHHCVGVLMHFPEIEEIKDIVICDSQVVFDSVTKLILNSFTFEKVSKQACDKFKETGQFSFKDIQKIAKNSKSDSLSPLKLVKLLEYQNIIASVRPGGPLPSSSLSPSPGLGPQSHQEENMVYFMPAVLRNANEEELHIKQSSTDPIPLIIHFKCGFVPIGVFCAMIASLVAKRWRLLDPSYGHTLCKNKITFRINGAYDLTLISKLKWYEIYIACISTKVQPLEKMCRHVLETVCDTLDLVISKMRYKQFTTSSSSDPTLYELGFKCPDHPNDDHLVINTPLSGVEEEVPSQSAKSLWLNHHKGTSVMICQGRSSEGGKSIDLRDGGFPRSFADQSLVWFGEVANTPLLPDSPPVDAPKITRHPESQSVVTGTPITFTVEATGDDLQFLWRKDDKDIYMNAFRLQCSRTDNTSTLSIQHVKKSDQGHYKCLVKNPIEKSGIKSDVAELVVRHNWKKTFTIVILVLLVLLATSSGVWLLASVDQLHPSDHGSQFNYDGHPSLYVLRRFPVKDHFIDIAEKIATDYKLFGTQLLKDSDGSKVRIIEMKHQAPVDITVEILEQWLQGRGRIPITWQTFVQCLRDTKLNVLADDVKSTLSEHNESKDKVPSKEL